MVWGRVCGYRILYKKRMLCCNPLQHSMYGKIAISTLVKLLFHHAGHFLAITQTLFSTSAKPDPWSTQSA